MESKAVRASVHCWLFKEKVFEIISGRHEEGRKTKLCTGLDQRRIVLNDRCSHLIRQNNSWVVTVWCEKNINWVWSFTSVSKTIRFYLASFDSSWFHNSPLYEIWFYNCSAYLCLSPLIWTPTNVQLDIISQRPWHSRWFESLYYSIVYIVLFFFFSPNYFTGLFPFSTSVARTSTFKLPHFWT